MCLKTWLQKDETLDEEGKSKGVKEFHGFPIQGKVISQ